MPVFFSIHPRTRKKLDERGFKLSPYIIESKPVGFFDYIQLQRNAFCVLSDSGTVPEESSILDFPAVSIRTSTERQEALIHGSFELGGVDCKTIEAAICNARQAHRPTAQSEIVPDYAGTSASSIVSETIKQYVGLVNRETWLKD